MTGIKPYGDATDDGRVQVAFTLPLPQGDLARAAATELLHKMGFERIHLVHEKAMGPDFTFFIAYGTSLHAVDVDGLEVTPRDHPDLSYQEVNRLILEHLKRPLVVIGACTGTDAHTVGLDAILSLKGFAGDKGLEACSEMRVVNLGAQVTPDEIVQVVGDEGADAVLISQVVTQRDAHLLHLREVRDALIATGQRDRLILIGGGPRLEPRQAAELGYDRIFGRGTKPSEVASYLAWAISERLSA